MQFAKRALALLATLLLLVCGSGPAPAFAQQSSTAAIERSSSLAETNFSAAAEQPPPTEVNKSILFLEMKWTGYVHFQTATGQWSRSEAIELGGACTGWFASEDGYVVTAGHCIDPQEVRQGLINKFLTSVGQRPENYTPEVMAQWAVADKTGQAAPLLTVVVMQLPNVEGAVVTTPTEAEPKALQPLVEGDHALLKIDMTGTPALAIAETLPSVGEDVAAYGFPASLQTGVDIANLQVSRKTGTVSSFQTKNNVSFTETSVAMSGGMSGGPMVTTENNAVIGVNSHGPPNEPQSFNFASDTIMLNNLLADNNVQTVSPESAEAEDSADADSGGQPAFPPADESVDSSSDTEAEGNDAGVVWAIVASVVVIAVVALVVTLYVRRRNQQRESEVSSADNDPSSP